jgi:peroxiredoxin
MRTAAGGEIRLPSATEGSYAVLLVYRGSWCRYCTGQLRSFVGRHQSLIDEGITTVALSADPEAVARQTVTELGIPFPVGCDVSVRDVAPALECYTDPAGTFFQSTGFVLGPDGTVMLAVYSSGAIGRLGPVDVQAFVSRHRSMTAAADAH